MRAGSRRGKGWIPSNRRAWQQGAALVMVTWALAIIGAVVAAYLARGLVEAEANREARETAAGRSLAQAGLACFVQRFLADEDGADGPGDDWLTAEEALAALVEGQVTVDISDCGSRINLNLADQSALLALFDGEKAPAEAILDWRDADDEPRPAGAEKDYYQSLTPPLAPANGFFDCPEEIWLVKEAEEYRQVIEAETTVHGPANPNLIAPPVWAQILKAAGIDDWKAGLLTEEFAAAQTEAAKAGRVPFPEPDDLRKLPAMTGMTSDLLAPYLIFRGQVNPNFASERALRIALAQLGVKVEKARAIIEARESGPFKDLDEFASLLSQGEQKFRRNWVGQIFTMQTVLVQVDVEARTKAGTTYRIAAVVERYHPANERRRWQARFLYWREWPGQGSPAAADEQSGG